MSDIPEICPDCGEPDLWTADGHCVALRCSELAALRERAERAEAALWEMDKAFGSSDYPSAAHKVLHLRRLLSAALADAPEARP